MLSLIVGCYLVVLLAIGWWCHHSRISGMTDFLLAGRRLGIPLCTAAMAATHFGGGAVLGGASYGFRHGLAGAWYGIATGIGLLLLALLTASRFRELAIYTVPDYLALRYQSRCLRVLAALLSLAALVGILAAQVNAARSAFSITGLSPTAAAVLATLVFVVYTTFGGLWAAAISDLFQLLIAGIGVVIAAVVVLLEVESRGGLRVLLEQQEVGETYFQLSGAGPSFILWLLLPTVMYTLIGQDFYQRLLAARSARVARISALAGGILLLVISVFPVIIGMGARAISGLEMERSTEAMPWVLQNLLSPLLGGIILAAILAAVMSTADSLLTSATSHVVKDIWIETWHAGEPQDEVRLLVLARWVTVAVGLAALLVGLLSPGIVSILIVSYTLYTAGVLVPVLGGLVSRRAGATAAIAALFAGTAVALFGLITDLQLGEVPTEVCAAAVSAVVFLACTTVSPAREP